MLIHFWDLPEDRNYIVLKEKLRDKMVKLLKNKEYSWKIKNKIKNGKISIKKLKKISRNEKISLGILEKNILWIGGNNSKGLSNPKLPFNLSNRDGARFISAITNDGCLTKSNKKNCHGRLMYDNFDKTLRDSVIKNYLCIFGGKLNEVAFRNYKNKKFLEFSSVIRDVVELILKSKGPKTESNLKIPSFVFDNKENMLGWIEQTIADEGEIKHNPNKYRRAIVWRRSLDVTNTFNKKATEEISIRQLSIKLQRLVQKQKCKLIEAEKKILDLLGIRYRVYNLGIYPTMNNKIRTRWQISISKRKNLLKLRKLIKIPSEKKEKKFTKLFKGYKRYKEPLKVRNAVIGLGENNKNFTSTDLKIKMGYKNVNPAIKWIRQFEKEGMIRKIKRSSYGHGNYRKPAEYQLILNK